VAVGKGAGQAGSLGTEQVHGCLDAKVQLLSGDDLPAARKQSAGDQGLGGDHGLLVDGIHHLGADVPAQDVLLFG
jgi:hypothetical protein